jgi:hypothetical protein
VTNRTHKEFWQLYESLPPEVQHDARRAFAFFQQNPNHPSLRFKPLKGLNQVYSVRIGIHYRAVAKRNKDVLHWFWIGSHSDFDKEFS